MFITGSLAFADLNHDGKLDAVVFNAAGGSVSIFLGDGDGTFTSGPSYAVTSAETTSFAMADVDGDGHIDIIAPLGSPPNAPTVLGLEAQVLYGKGDGTFENPVAVSTPHWAAYIAAADLNLDGMADLV
jgi:Tfp pilus tip-associated adhesin PilY1